MARAIRTSQMTPAAELRVTPADELRELLGRVEKRLANLRGSGQEAAELLLDLDRIDELWPELEAQGVDLRPEAGRWDTIQAQLRRNGPRVLRELWAAGGLDQLRARQHGAATGLAWWWQLDDLVRQESIIRRRRTLVTLGVVAMVAVGAWLLLRTLFPVDPQVQAALSARLRASRRSSTTATTQGRWRTSRRRLSIRPTIRMYGSASVRCWRSWAIRGPRRRTMTVRSGSASARVSSGARRHLPGLFMYDEACADTRRSWPRSRRTQSRWYYLGSVYEGQGKLELAVDALRKRPCASESNQSGLVALARYRMAMLMQQVGLGDMREPEPTVTATPEA